jgi:hypothetical protein
MTHYINFARDLAFPAEQVHCLLIFTDHGFGNETEGMIFAPGLDIARLLNWMLEALLFFLRGVFLWLCSFIVFII